MNGSLASDLLAHLRRIGPARASELRAHLGISQPLFSRLARTLAGQLLVAGRARATRYAARREIDGVGSTTPLYAIAADGAVHTIATLHAIEPAGFWVEGSGDAIDSRFYEDLPYFLHDQRPAGFLGRLIPSRHHDLALPAEISRWSGDDFLRYAVVEGWDLPGDLLLGERSLARYLEHARSPLPGVASNDRARLYPLIVEQLLEHGPAGSSAAGEQPKFLTRRESDGVALLVKFSPPMHSEVGRRWADLLVCESVAHQLLAAHGLGTPSSQLVEAGGRLFLEVERFDRTAAGGRRGVMSLLALDLEFVGSDLNSWSATAGELMRLGRIEESQILETIERLELFGRLIANNDMHLGNLSLMVRGEQIVDVAPAYDMLPMLFAPMHGQLPTRSFVPPIPAPSLARHWPWASEAALEFWRTCAAHPMLSPDFAVVARACADGVRSLDKIGQLLPR